MVRHAHLTTPVTRPVFRVDPKRLITALLVVVVCVGLVSGLAVASAQTAGQTATQKVDLYVGEVLQVYADKRSIQVVTLIGNLSTASYPQDAVFPTGTFELGASSPSKYGLKVTFSGDEPYTVRLVRAGNQRPSTELLSYFISSGDFLLEVEVTFQPKPQGSAGSQTLWEAFTSWLTRFGEAFPIWVKLLYLVLGVQFAFVGGMWIRFEGRRRQQDNVISAFDGGNVAYLWTDVVYRFLMAAFVVLAVIMGGQYLLVLILRYMFLAPVELLSLWDLFVLGFGAGIVLIAYALRTMLGRSFDLRPLEDE